MGSTSENAYPWPLTKEGSNGLPVSLTQQLLKEGKKNKDLRIWEHKDSTREKMTVFHPELRSGLIPAP